MSEICSDDYKEFIECIRWKSSLKELIYIQRPTNKCFMVEGKPVSDWTNMYGIYGYLLLYMGQALFIVFHFSPTKCQECGYAEDTKVNIM